MTTSKNNILAASSLIILSLFAFKGKKEKPLVLGADLRWKTEVSYDQHAGISGYVVHNNKSTELVIFNADNEALRSLLKTVSTIGNPVKRIVIEKTSGTAQVQEIINLKKKFPQAVILVATER